MKMIIVLMITVDSKIYAILELEEKNIILSVNIYIFLHYNN